jgi:hypothetical protein
MHVLEEAPTFNLDALALNQANASVIAESGALIECDEYCVEKGLLFEQGLVHQVAGSWKAGSRDRVQTFSRHQVIRFFLKSRQVQFVDLAVKSQKVLRCVSVRTANPILETKTNHSPVI